MHDLSERTPVACIPFGAERQSRTSLARARHLYAARLQDIRTPANPSSQPVRLASRRAQSQASVGARSRRCEQTRLSTASRANIEWLLQRFQADLACPLQSEPILACKAAADACAEGAKVGLGGWFISSRSVSWFAETWDFQEVQQQWPCLTKEAQRCIARFETLVQLALMRIAWTAEGQAVRGICVPSGTDNTAPEAGVNKLFTKGHQLVAAWAYKHKWSVLASHIPGEHNVWADQLSRGNTSAFDGKPQARLRFRPHDFWPHKSMLSLHPPDSPWRPEHKSASQTL